MPGFKTFSIIEPVSRELLEIVARELGFNLEQYPAYAHPQEDYLLQSERHPIFAVADGVTLEPNLLNGYPNPSPAGEAAKLFCEAAVAKAEELYQKFSEERLVQVFRAGNRAVGALNTQHGRSKRNSNFWDFDLFAATAAFAVLKGYTLYWASICDSYVLHLGRGCAQKFRSPECWPKMHRHLPADWGSLDVVEQKKRIRKIYRNGIGRRGELIGYGVVTGEKAAERYLNHGSLTLEGGDVVALFTDGFEEYFKLPQFAELFVRWPADPEKQVKRFTRARAAEDPRRFGHERTLIAISFSS